MQLDKNISNKIGRFALAMLTVSAIFSLRNLPNAAEFGIASITLLVIAALLFFIPVAFMTAELASTWPESGGSYIWVSKAFGKPMGFFSLWWAWMESIAWFPAILAFTSKMFWAMFGISVSNVMTLVTIIVVLFGTTALNCRGIKTASGLTLVGVLFGTIIPGVLIIGLGLWWVFSGQLVHIDWNWSSLLPAGGTINHLVLFSGIVLSLAGVECAAFHVKDMKNPQKDYPWALAMGVSIILLISILGSLTIACVVPQSELNLVSGILQTFQVFLADVNLLGFLPVIAGCLFLGSLAGINTWTVGPAKGMLVCATDGFLPQTLKTVNSHGVPVNLLLLQVLVASSLSLVFLYLPEDGSAYWILTALSTIFTVGQYAFIYAAGLRLRYKYPDVKRAYQVPGGKFGILGIVIIGILFCAMTFGISFLPPAQLDTGEDWIYSGFLVFCFISLSLPAIWMIACAKCKKIK